MPNITVKPIPRFIDVYHGDLFNADVRRSLHLNDDMAALVTAGMWGFVHKTDQGIGMTDQAFGQRIIAAKSVGLRVAGYHFNTGDTVQGQVNHHKDVIGDDASILPILDWEDNRKTQMTLVEFIQYLILADEVFKRPIPVYSGNRAKTLLANASAEVIEVCSKRYLWGCEYGSMFKDRMDDGKPLPFKDIPFWQFTGDGIGPLPHTMPGVATKGIDINHFGGTRDEFNAIWDYRG